MAGKHGRINMAGQTVNGWIVLAAFPVGTSDRGTLWRVQHGCGPQGQPMNILGTQLRAYPPKRCDGCRVGKRTGRPRQVRP